LLERALRNLIENALRYTKKGGILVGVRQRGERVRIDVVDTGIGIPADKKAEIFEEFYQVNNPGRDGTQGMGLGLSIVARLARLMGAESAGGFASRSRIALFFAASPSLWQRRQS
jgi:signal transduction histidine kinase